MLKDSFPLFAWIEKLKNPTILKKDIYAWITVSFVLIPQSMAYAQLAWLPVQIWLYTSFVPVIIASLFGVSAKMITSSITIMSLMTLTALSSFAMPWSEEYIALAPILAFFIWIFYILLWKLRLGILVDFLSHPVTIWFTNAAAIITIISQIPKIFWVDKWIWINYFFEILSLWENIFTFTDFPTLIFWIWSILFLILWRVFLPKKPIVLFLLLLSILISYYIDFNWEYGWKIIGNIPAWLPYINLFFITDSWKYLDFYQLIELFLFAMIIALVWFTQTISVAKYLSYIWQNRLSPNKELISQWIANISSSFFGWYSVAWSLSRTALNIRAGAETWFSWVIAWLMVGITIIFLTPYIFYLPIASLWAVIILAVYQMIQFKPLWQAWKIEKQDAVIWIITFIVSIVSVPNIEIWIITGIFLSLFLFVYNSIRPKIVELWYYKDDTYRDIELFGLKSSEDIWVYRFDGNMYFANAWYFESSILNFIAQKKNIKYVILDFEWINNIDSTAEKTIVSLTRQLQENNIKVYISWVRTWVFRKLNTSKFIKNFWEKRMLTNISEALDIIEEKNWKYIDTSPLRKHKKDKQKLPTLDKKIMKKIENLWE